MAEEKSKVLFVCTMNYQRSRTAEEMYKDDVRFEVQSAGTAKDAFQGVNDDNLNWADLIVVMEKRHRNKIRKAFPQVYITKKIVCLYIEDEFDFMQKELINLIKYKFEKVI